MKSHTVRFFFKKKRNNYEWSVYQWKIEDFKKARLKVTEVDLDAGEQILSVENVRA